MIHYIYSVTALKVVAPYTLNIQFEDGSTQTINFKPILKGEMYGPLLDVNLFNQVKIVPEVHTLVWPNSADFDPATLHD
ncbi:MAG: DUF2442 domain-containing protein [bacterium]